MSIDDDSRECAFRRIHEEDPTLPATLVRHHPSTLLSLHVLWRVSDASRRSATATTNHHGNSCLCIHYHPKEHTVEEGFWLDEL